MSSSLPKVRAEILDAWQRSPSLRSAFADYQAFAYACAGAHVRGVSDILDHCNARDVAFESAFAEARDRLRTRLDPRFATSSGLVSRRGNRLAVWLYGPIGTDEQGLANAHEMASGIASNADADVLTLRISSIGGCVEQARRIANAVRSFPGRSLAIVDDVCFSAAVLVAVSADRVLARADSVLMLHQTSRVTYGNADEMVRAAVELRRTDREYVQALCRFRNPTRLLAWRLDELMANTTYLSALQAVALGLVDAIASPLSSHRSVELSSEADPSLNRSNVYGAKK